MNHALLLTSSSRGEVNYNYIVITDHRYKTKNELCRYIYKQAILHLATKNNFNNIDAVAAFSSAKAAYMPTGVAYRDNSCAVAVQM